MNKHDFAVKVAAENPGLSQAGLAKLLTTIDPVNFRNLEQARGVARKVIGGGKAQLPTDFVPTTDTAIEVPDTQPTINCLTEDELRRKYDVFYIVKQAADKLRVGVFVPESEFARQAGLRGQQGSRMALDNPELNRYHGKAGGTVYWSHPDSITKMKKETILS